MRAPMYTNSQIKHANSNTHAHTHTHIADKNAKVVKKLRRAEKTATDHKQIAVIGGKKVGGKDVVEDGDAVRTRVSSRNPKERSNTSKADGASTAVPDSRIKVTDFRVSAATVRALAADNITY
jgi:hypothetical protein